MGNEVSNVAVSRKSVSAEATGKPESGMKKSRKKNEITLLSFGEKIIKNITIFFLF